MKFGQYELLELIAVGGMAEVFKGRVVAAEGFEKFVAIKRILPDLAEDDRFVTMLLTEARIHSALSHRNIVQIHDLGISEDGQYFIVLEFIEGYDLRMIMERLTADREIVPEALSLHIASELAQGLHFAHDQLGPDGQRLGLIHRDVTPSNVLISFAGEVKLSDFGLAKRTRDRSVVGSLKGNLSYMSPEQAMQASLDRRTDVFSLGAVLFEMLTGRRLREITNEVAAWSHVASGVIPSAREIRPDLPIELERLLDRALAPDPANRFADAAAFGAAIRDVLADMNVAVGASDLGALLQMLSPPRQPRHLMLEQSRVIRLGPEAQALSEAFAAPVTPAPVTRTAGPTPRRPAGSSGAAVVPVTGLVDGADAHAAAPPGPRGQTPARGLRRPTPAAPRVQPGAARQSARWPAPAAGANPALRKSAEWPVPPPAPPNPLRRSAEWPAPPNPLRRSGEWPAPAARPPGALRRSGEWPAGPPPPSTPTRPTPGNSYPPPHAATRPTPGSAYRPPRPAVPGQAVAGSAMGAPSRGAGERIARETARIHVRAPSHRGRTFVLLLLLVGGAAASVHRYVVPLDVLAAWREPATLAIASIPPGAALRLDGVALASSPTTVRVKRDFADHVVDATLAGYLPAQAHIRFDKSLGLTSLLQLERDPGAATAPPPDPKPTRKGSAAGAN